MMLVECFGLCSSGPPAVAPAGPDGEPWLVGTGLSLATVVDALEDDGSPAAVAARLGLHEQQVRLALEHLERSGGGLGP